MRKRSILRPRDLEEIRRRYLAGETMAPLQKCFEIGQARIRQILVDAGVQIRTRKDWDAGGPPSIPIDPQYLRDSAAQGLSTKEMAAALGCCQEAVRERLKKLGIRGLPRGAQPGSRNSSWKGGRRFDKSGYVLLHAPDHPDAASNGYIREHRLVMEKKLGRRLKKKEVVHHRDKNKQNNHPDNLSLYPSNGRHLGEELAGRCPRWTPEGKARILFAAQHKRRKPKKPSLVG